MVEQRTRAAVYLRISLDREMDGLAIDRQRSDCLTIAKARGWEVVGEYLDQSKSATDKATRRPEYERMVRDYAAGQFGAIICYDLDRLTRQPRQLEDWIDAAEERGLLLVTANGEADLSTDGGRMYARIKAAVARGEVERKSARQSSGQRQRAMQGRVPKGVRPLGYDLDGGVIAREAEGVRAIYAAFCTGSSLRSIASALSGLEDPPGTTEKRVPPAVPVLRRHTRTLALERNERRREKQLEPRPVPADGPWSPSTVLGILRNPRYAGFSTYTPKTVSPAGNKRRSWRAAILRDEEGDPVLGQWEAIVDKGTWWTAQDLLDSEERVTNRSGTDRKHLGSGLYRCGICGARVRGHSTRYRCAGHVLRSRAQVDAYVVEVVRQRLDLPDLADLLAEDHSGRLDAISVEIREHRARVVRARRDYGKELIRAADLKEIRDDRESAIAALEAEQSQLRASSPQGTVLEAPDPVAAFDEADLATRRATIDALIDVRLLPHAHGVKTFNPDTVHITAR